MIPWPKGIIFDFDGVLVDTEWAIYQSWVRLFAREGQEISIATYSPCLGAGYSHWNPADHLEKLTGRKYDWDTENAERQKFIESELSLHGLMPGAERLLKWCDARGIRTAVASSSSRRWVGGWLERLGITDRFDAVFCRTDGFPVKPDPALFIAAQEALGFPKDRCLIVEDSENGTIAAQNAGIRCVAIPNRMTASSDFTRAALQADSLTELLRILGKITPKGR